MRNLLVIPTEKIFRFDEESVCHSDREDFLLRRGILFLFQHGIFMFSIWRDSSVAEKLLQNDNGLLSFRQRSFFTSTRNLNVIPIEKFLLRRGICLSFRHGIFMFSIWRDSSVAEKLLQNDNGLLSFRQRRFLFRRGISMSFRQRRFFTSTRNLIFIPTWNFYVFDR